MATQSIAQIPEVLPFTLPESPTYAELASKVRQMEEERESWIQTLTLSHGTDHKGNSCWLGRGGVTCPEKWIRLNHVPADSTFEEAKAICESYDYGYPLRVVLYRVQ